MSVVHFYYFLQLKIIWAIKLKPKFIFFPSVCIFSNQIPGSFLQIRPADNALKRSRENSLWQRFGAGSLCRQVCHRIP